MSIVKSVKAPHSINIRKIILTAWRCNHHQYTIEGHWQSSKFQTVKKIFGRWWWSYHHKYLQTIVAIHKVEIGSSIELEAGHRHNTCKVHKTRHIENGNTHTHSSSLSYQNNSMKYIFKRQNKLNWLNLNKNPWKYCQLRHLGRKKNMCVYCHMLKKSRVGQSALFFFFNYRQNWK